jgi:uncharacterized damage-inducible protein DinB
MITFAAMGKDRSMDARLSEILDRMETARADLLTAVRDLPEEQQRARPAPERWSIAEVVEHLSIIEGRVTQLLTQATSQPPSPDATTPPDNGAHTIDRNVILDRTTRVKSREANDPTGQVDLPTGLARLQESRAQLVTFVQSADASALARVSHPHPVFGPLSGLQWLDLVGAHEARHTLQIHEIREQLQSVAH